MNRSKILLVIMSLVFPSLNQAVRVLHKHHIFLFISTKQVQKLYNLDDANQSNPNKLQETISFLFWYHNVRIMKVSQFFARNIQIQTVPRLQKLQLIIQIYKCQRQAMLSIAALYQAMTLKNLFHFHSLIIKSMSKFMLTFNIFSHL